MHIGPARCLTDLEHSNALTVAKEVIASKFSRTASGTKINPQIFNHMKWRHGFILGTGHMKWRHGFILGTEVR